MLDKDVSRLQWESCEGGEEDARRRLRFAKPVRKTVMVKSSGRPRMNAKRLPGYGVVWCGVVNWCGDL